MNKKNTKKYGTTGILWALYLIVGVVAFLVSDFYFKFTLKDAIIFGAVNLVVVIVITEGLDLIFKKTKMRQESKKAAGETPGDDTTAKGDDVAAEAAPVNDSPKNEVAPELEHGEVVNSQLDSNDSNDAAEPVVNDRSEKRKGLGYFARSRKSAVVETTVESEPIEEPVVSTEQETTEIIADDEAPILITEDTKEADDNVNVGEPAVKESTSPHAAETIVEPIAEEAPKPRGRRANPEAIIDAPTSSIPVITPDMIKPRAVAPVVDTHAPEEPVVEAPYLSADEFLNTTKLTSPRAIVREYQRLGGKDDIYSILMERQK